jgi:tetratricopeptide (TPR) repeat protein
VAKKKRPSARRSPVADRRLREALEGVDSLMRRRRWPEAHDLLNDLSRTYPQRPEILERLVEVAVQMQDAHTYQYGCEMLYVLRPRDPYLPFMLTLAYIKSGWLALALSMGRRALAQDPANEKAPSTRKMLAELEPLLHRQVADLGLEGPDGLECLTLHDQVRSLLAQGRYARARDAAEELAKRRPRFPPAYNNGAEASFHDGRLAQAIDLTQRLLAIDPENVFARANLVRFLCVSGKWDEARQEADRLKAQRPAAKDLAVKQADALTWLGDDAGVLAVLEQSQSLPAVEGPEDDAFLEHLAAVAAFRQGREEEARRHWQAALRAVPHFEPARHNLDDLKLPAAERNAPWSYAFQYFVPRKLVGGLLAKVTPAGKRHDNDAVEREARRYLEEHSELEGLVPLLLDRSDGPGREFALHLAGLFRTPAMLQAVRDFALGQRGADQLRVKAVAMADEAGLLPGGPPQLWLGGEWRGGTVQRFEIHAEPIERTHAPGVSELLTEGIEALRAGQDARAERVLRRALAIDPDDPLVMNNLAVACAHLGRTEETEVLSLRLHERHPDYLFGRTALASLSAERGDLERARQLLAPLLTRQRLHVSEFSALCMAQVNLALAEQNREQARHWLDMWRRAMPDHPSLGLFEERLRRWD